MKPARRRRRHHRRPTHRLALCRRRPVRVVFPSAPARWHRVLWPRHGSSRSAKSGGGGTGLADAPNAGFVRPAGSWRDAGCGAAAVAAAAAAATEYVLLQDALPFGLRAGLRARRARQERSLRRQASRAGGQGTLAGSVLVAPGRHPLLQPLQS